VWVEWVDTAVTITYKHMSQALCAVLHSVLCCTMCSAQQRQFASTVCCCRAVLHYVLRTAHTQLASTMCNCRALLHYVLRTANTIQKHFVQLPCTAALCAPHSRHYVLRTAAALCASNSPVRTLCSQHYVPPNCPPPMPDPPLCPIRPCATELSAPTASNNGACDWCVVVSCGVVCGICFRCCNVVCAVCLYRCCLFVVVMYCCLVCLVMCVVLLLRCLTNTSHTHDIQHTTHTCWTNLANDTKQ
jgi:hypothetical protein